MRSAIALAAIAIIVGAFLLIHALSVEADFLCSKYSVTASGVNYYTPGYTKVINIADVAAKELSVSLRVKSQARMFVIVYEEWDGGSRVLWTCGETSFVDQTLHFNNTKGPVYVKIQILPANIKPVRVSHLVEVNYTVCP